MEQRSRSKTASVLSETEEGGATPANTQLPTPAPSPLSSPKPISPAKAWLLSISATPEERSQPSSYLPSPTLGSTPTATKNTPFVNDFFEVRQSTKGGLGAFALKDIPKGTVIMAEEPLFRALLVQVFWKYDELSDDQKKEYKTLSCWFGIEDHKVAAIFTTNRFVE